MTTTPPALRQAVTAQALTTVLSGGGALRESMIPYLFFRDPQRSPAHLELAVGVGASVAQGGRQKSGGIVVANTEVRVALAYQIPTHLPSIDAALGIGDELRRKLLEQGPTYPVSFALTWLREENAALVPGWVVVENVFTALHYMTV